MVAEKWGYAALAADIFGKDNQEVAGELRLSLTLKFRDDPPLFVSRIQAAVDLLMAMPEVDSDNISIMGYCFGGTGVLEYGLMGKDGVKGIVSFHGGLSTIDEADENTIFVPKVLILSGGEDDSASTINGLEMILDKAEAPWEITRYSNVVHAFTVFDDGMSFFVCELFLGTISRPFTNSCRFLQIINAARYNEWADMRSWDSAHQFLQEVFAEAEFETSLAEEFAVESIDYEDVDGTQFRGYLAMPDESFVRPLPAVVIFSDWNGVNAYEKKRATALAEMGYVAFAADYYGTDLQEDLTMDDNIEQSTKLFSNPEMWTRRMQLAIDQIKTMPKVDSDKIAIIGYCLGGSGVVLYGNSGGEDAKAAVAFHGNFQSVPENAGDIMPYTLLLAGGDDGLHGNQTDIEQVFNAGNADWEITRFAGLGHGFTEPDAESYSLVGDARSWASMMTVFEDLGLVPVKKTPEPSSMPSSAPSPMPSSSPSKEDEDGAATMGLLTSAVALVAALFVV
jgi:dienelactone hydrolase